MAYSEEVKKSILERIKSGEAIKGISQTTGISVATLYNWRRSAIVNSESHEKKVSKEIKQLMREGRLEEAKEKCKEFPKNEAIQSQYITILMREGSLEEAKEKCKGFPKYEAIQSQYITILISEKTKEGLYEAKRIANKKRFRNAKNLQRKLEKVEKLLEEISLDEEMLKRQTVVDNKQDKKNLLNVIKTKLYCDDVTLDFLQQIKQDKENLTDWERVVVLLAIYDKQKNHKSSEKVLKESKKSFENDVRKIKILNNLQNVILSKKPRAFDWSMFDKILGWQLDEDVHQEIKSKRESEKANGEERKRIEIEITRKKAEKKQDSTARVTKEVNYITSPVQAIQPAILIERAKPKRVNKKGHIEQEVKLQSQTIHTIFADELIQLKAKIAYKNQDDTMHDFDVTEIIENKPLTDFRAKMQTILLFRKYGMKSVTDEKLKVESQIYDDINQMYFYQKRNPEYDNTKLLEEIMKKISKVQGNNEYAYELVDEVLEKGRDR